ncbi:MAG: type II secretion system protein, partial [Verrucomicrobiae bacterium]|nr:type II secretion system protein [Verrucomicrobiae bacterium]
MKRDALAFTLIELLVVITIVSILAALLAPALAGAKDRAKTAKCMSGIRSWGQALIMYAEDHDKTLASLNCDDTTYYVVSRALYGHYIYPAEAFQCPSSKGDVTRVTLGYPWGHRIIEWNGADIVHPGNFDYELNIGQPEFLNTEYNQWLRPNNVVVM